VAAVVAAALAIGAAGCSSDSKSADDTPTVTAAPRSDKGTTEADLKAAATTLAADNLQDSVDTYAYISAKCKAKFTEAQWKTNQHQITEGLRAALPAFKDAKVGTVTVRNVTPTSGEAQIVVLDSKGAELVKPADASWNSWVVEDGLWVTEECPAASELAGG